MSGCFIDDPFCWLAGISGESAISASATDLSGVEGPKELPVGLPFALSASLSEGLPDFRGLYDTDGSSGIASSFSLHSFSSRFGSISMPRFGLDLVRFVKGRKGAE